MNLAYPYLAKLGMDEQEVGQVAGDLIKRATDLGIGGGDSEEDGQEASTEQSDTQSEEILADNTSSTSTKREPEGEIKFSVAIIADSHIANDLAEYIENKNYLKQGVELATQEKANVLIHVGDITNWGVVTDLKEAKEILSKFDGDYYTLPGDRDLAQSLGPSNFDSVFPNRFQTFTLNDVNFVLFDNSANYTLIDQENIDWLQDNLEDADFLIMSQPLLTNGLSYPFNCTYMGTTCSEPESESTKEKQVAVKAQRNELLDIIRESGVKAIIAGDHHKSSSVSDPVNESLTHYVVGSVGGTVGEYSQSVLQSQRIGILNVYESGDYELVDVTLDQLKEPQETDSE